MTLAQNDIERQVAEAVPIAGLVPTARVAQVVLFARNPNLAELMTREMGLDAGVNGRVVSGTLSQALERRDEDWSKLNFVVIEVCDEAADLLAISQLKALPYTALHCIAVTTGDVSDEMTQRFLTAGASELISLTLPEPEDEHTSTSAAPKVDLQAGGEVSVVLRARGGAGATTVAVNLAVAQALHAQDGKTALVDLDIQNGSVSLALDLEDSPHTTEFVKGVAIPDGAFLVAAMQRHPTGLDVLTAPDVFAPLTAITPAMIAELLGALKARYDHVIIDMPQALVDWMSPVLSSAARVLLVSDMTLPALKRSKKLIALIAEEHMTLPVKIVVNFERRPIMQSVVHREAASLIGQPLDHWIPADTKVARRALDLGVPFALGAKRSGITRAIKALRETTFAPAKQG